MILVTGATGKNGAEILKLLSGRKERIRAMVRKKNQIANVAIEETNSTAGKSAWRRRARVRE